MTARLALPLALMLFARVATCAPQTTVSFDTGTKLLFADAAHTAPLSGGLPFDGDGCAVQIGYYDAATVGHPFDGAWVPLTGETSANTALRRSSIGDANTNGAGTGTMAVSVTFVAGSGASGNLLPAPGTPLAIRFYNGPSIVVATAFNAVSSDAWLWESPLEAPANPEIALSLENAQLVWLGGIGSAFHTAIAIGGGPPASAPLAGGYQGLVVTEDASNFAHIGTFGVTVMEPSGAFSALLILGGKRFSIRGVLDAAGTWTGTVVVSNTHAIGITFTVSGTQLGGSIYDQGVVSQIGGAFSAAYTLAHPSPFAGTYTLLLAPRKGGTGTGWGTLTIDVSGNMRLAGSLPDNTAFSAARQMLATGEVLIGVPLYKPAGIAGGLVGGIVFRDAPGTSDADGVLHWHKPASATSVFYPAGIDTDVDAILSKYNPLPHALSVNLSPAALAAGNLSLVLGGGGLASPVTAPATLTANNALGTVNPLANHITLSLLAATGYFSGGYQPPNAARPAVIRGVIFQKQQLGAGFFPGTGQTGEVRLTPVR